MSRIHPNRENRRVDLSKVIENVGDDHHHLHHHHNVLTVWKRSSMSFQGTDGFTVFDSVGRLAFRVDNYTRKEGRRGSGGGLVLMDGSGKPLLTLKPQMLSMQCQWNGYRGDQLGHRTSPKSAEFTIRRPRSALTIHGSNNLKEYEAEVFMGSSKSGGGGANKGKDRTPDLVVEGMFRRRNCKIKTPGGVVVARIARKRVENTTILLGDDVFRLTVEPGFDPDLVMAFVIVLDRISPKPLAPVLCS